MIFVWCFHLWDLQDDYFDVFLILSGRVSKSTLFSIDHILNVLHHAFLFSAFLVLFSFTFSYLCVPLYFWFPWYLLLFCIFLHLSASWLSVPFDADLVTHCWELMNSVAMYGSLSLPYMWLLSKVSEHTCEG